MRRVVAVVVAALVALTTMSLPARAAYQRATTASWVPNQPVYAIAVTPKRVYLGGEFTRLTNPDTGASIARSGLVALDRATGNPITSWSANTDLAVRALAVGGGRLYVGGDFTTVDGVARAGLAALGSDGTPVAGWDPAPNGRVWDLVVDGSGLYVGGNFGQIGATQRPGVARLDIATGALDYAFNAAVTGGRVQALASSAGVLYLGGTFTGLGGQVREFVGAVSAADGSVTSWAPGSLCSNCRVRDLAVDSGAVLGAVGGEPGGRAAAWNAADGSLLWAKDADGEVQAVVARAGTAYFGGHFSVRFGASARSQLAAVDVASGSVLPFAPATRGDALPGVWALDARSDALRVGGGTALANSPYERYLSLPDGVVAPLPTTVRLSLTLNGCAGCRVRAVQSVKGRTAVWSTSWRRATKGHVTLGVPRTRTAGLTIQVKAPWERRPLKTTQIVVAYAGKAIGSNVSAAAAARQTSGSPCFAGTSRGRLGWTVGVRRAKVAARSGLTLGSRAWLVSTRAATDPVLSTPRGVASTRRATRCG